MFLDEDYYNIGKDQNLRDAITCGVDSVVLDLISHEESDDFCLKF